MDLVMRKQHWPAHQRRMAGFVLAATLVHSIVLLGLWDSSLGVRPELPDWMNIKLVAGLDESGDKQIQTSADRVVHQIKPLTNVNGESSPQTPEKAPAQPPAEAEHFVKANSRPFEHQNPKPFYPAVARQRGMQGLVLLRVDVNIRGKVSSIELKKSSGYRLLDHAALASVKQWQFIPAKKDNQVIASIVEVPIRFELKAF